MTYAIENTDLQLSLQPPSGTWSLYSRRWNGPFIEDARLGAAYRRGLSRQRALDRWEPVGVAREARTLDPHGPAQSLTLQIGPNHDGLLFEVTFALPEEHPLLLWQIAVHNQGSRPVYLDRLELLKVGFPVHPRTLFTAGETITTHIQERVQFKGALRPHPDPGELAFFSNGWQSWTYNGVYGPLDRPRHTRMGFLRTPATANAGTPLPHRRGHFVSEMFGVLGDRTHRTGVLAGFLSQQEHFGSLEVWTDPHHPTLWMWAHGDGARLDPGAVAFTDWACLQFLHLDTADPLAPYLEAVARQHNLDAAAEREIPTGWCSWYHFYEAVSAGDVRHNLQATRALRPEAPLQLIQIDDGFESQVGDWYTFGPGFPEGVAPLAAEIREAGMTPGLWLAPFIVHRQSQLAHRHPEWLLRGRFGIPVNAGYNWNSLATALDLSHPQPLEYAAEVVHTAVHRWGFPYLKLDFLYAGALPGRRHDPTRTRAQVLRAGLQALREAAGAETFLLACGCPLGSAIGLVDAMRIGPDVSDFWDPRVKGVKFFFNREPDIPAAANSVQSSLARAPLHRRWWINDPDCLLLRPETSLTLEEVRSLATVVALTGGSLLVSDHLPALPPERLAILRALLPLIGKRPHVLDWFDSATPARLQLDLHGPPGARPERSRRAWHLVALFNWGDRPRDLTLRLGDFYLDPGAEYLARDFWRRETHRVAAGELTFQAVPAHGVVLLALRPHHPRRPLYVGGDLHISQGLEVRDWQLAPGQLQLTLERPGLAQGEVELYLPGQLQSAVLDGEPAPSEATGHGTYRFSVRFKHTAKLDLTWDPRDRRKSV